MSGKLLSVVRDDPVCRRLSQVSMMAQMQNIIDFPPAAKLDASARLDPSRASEQELECELVFMGKGRCAVCHVPQTAFMDNNMHDLKLERFYKIGQTANDLVISPDGPIKTFTLRHCVASRTLHPICAMGGR